MKIDIIIGENKAFGELKYIENLLKIGNKFTIIIHNGGSLLLEVALFPRTLLSRSTTLFSTILKQYFLLYFFCILREKKLSERNKNLKEILSTNKII